MSNIFGDNFTISTWGESHGKALGAVIDGVKPGIDINIEAIRDELKRRRPGQSEIVTSRMEPDDCEILSGIIDGKSTGMPICIIVWNKDADSSKYEELKDVFRPGHADFSYYYKYGIRDHRGGGRSSGRETVARVIGGGIAKIILKQKGIKVRGFVRSIGSVDIGDMPVDKINFEERENNPVRCPDKKKANDMIKQIVAAKHDGDSVGGVVCIVISGVPKGLGDPVFDKIDANIGKAMFSIGSVKGVEVGAGFRVAGMKGSENNDQIGVDGFMSNNSGGILGGISTGQDIVIKIAVKPTPSISRTQKTIDKHGKEREIKIEGRHDPCICPRIVPVAESMAAIVIVDAILKQDELSEKRLSKEDIRYGIDRVDNEILTLLGRRYSLARLMGEYKKKYNLSIDDLRREKELLLRKRELARDYGLDGEFVEKLFISLINESKKIQRNGDSGENIHIQETKTNSDISESIGSEDKIQNDEPTDEKIDRTVEKSVDESLEGRDDSQKDDSQESDDVKEQVNSADIDNPKDKDVM
ncbi:chorismate synthase [Candidatus Woesearchaeota archaeon]|nr:chorismate synthase [Candidatus Woesearchaeota archaeon]